MITEGARARSGSRVEQRRLTQTFLACGISLAVTAVPGAGAPIKVQVVNADRSMERDNESWVIAVPADAAAVKATPTGVAAKLRRGQVTMDVVPGLWTFTATGPRLWAAPVEVAVDAKGTDVVLQAWPAGRVRGTLLVDRAVPLVEKLPVILESPPGTSLAAIPRTAIECPLGPSKIPQRQEFVCEVPAAPLDLAVSLTGFLGMYRWGVQPLAAKTLDLGDFALQRGASVVGWVEHSRPTRRPASGVSVVLRASADMDGDGDSPPIAAYSATTDFRGFFQIGPVTVGSYRALARHDENVSRAAAVEVRGETESVIATPLLLRPHGSLVVDVLPPADPNGGNWHLSLIEGSGDSPPVMRVRQARIPLSGQWQRANLAPGPYVLLVEDEAGARWATEMLEIADAEKEHLRIDVQPAVVAGSVHLGNDPIPDAMVVIGGRSVKVRLPLKTDVDGTFRGSVPLTQLPSQAAWPVGVQADSPTIRRSIATVPTRTSDGGFNLEIRLPKTRLSGTVVKESGAPWDSRAVVTLQNLAESRERAEVMIGVPAGSDAEFAFAGLEPGEYLLEARAGKTASTEQKHVSVRDSDGRPVQLVMREVRTVEGRVISFDGRPVREAGLKILPAQATVGLVGHTYTDVEGRFSTTVPANTTAALVSVAARDYAYRIFRTPLMGEPLDITVDRNGGTLVLRHGEPLEGEEGTYVLSAGAFENIRSLRRWAALHGVVPGSTGETMIPSVAPGEYSVCRSRISDYRDLIESRLPSTRCASGTLLPHSILALDVPPRSSTTE